MQHVFSPRVCLPKRVCWESKGKATRVRDLHKDTHDVILPSRPAAAYVNSCRFLPCRTLGPSREPSKIVWTVNLRKAFHLERVQRDNRHLLIESALTTTSGRAILTRSSGLNARKVHCAVCNNKDEWRSLAITIPQNQGCEKAYCVTFFTLTSSLFLPKQTELNEGCSTFPLMEQINSGILSFLFYIMVSSVTKARAVQETCISVLRKNDRRSFNKLFLTAAVSFSCRMFPFVYSVKH